MLIVYYLSNLIRIFSKGNNSQSEKIALRQLKKPLSEKMKKTWKDENYRFVIINNKINDQ